VLTERKRQTEAEGWTPAHDDEHRDGSLARVYQILDGVPYEWPASWDESWWKPKDQRRNLIRAAALLLAEIERLDRARDRGIAASPEKKP
jgi:hypothetical protein